MACTVKISDTAYKIIRGSLSIDSRIEQRSTARFTILDADNSAVFTKGMPVQIYDNNMILIFGGFVNKPEMKRLAPKSGMLHSLVCVDNHYLADKRLVIESYVAGTDAGDIVYDIWLKYLKHENITVGGIQTGLPLAEAIFNHINVSDAFDAIKEASGTFTWYIDEQKRLYFIDRTINKSWNLDGVNHQALKDSVRLSTGNDQHRNMQFVWGGTAITDPRQQNFTGDDSERTFTLDFPLAKAPTITEDSGLGPIPADVGIKGIDEDCDYYWSKGDPIIYAKVAPELGTDVEVHYEGQYPFIGAAINSEDILYRSVLEGSSGIVEDITREAQNETRDMARQSAAAKIAQYCQEAEKFIYSTYDDGLRAGQLQEITYEPFDFTSHKMLIEAVRASAEGDLVKYDVTCITGPVVGDWTRFFARLLKRQDLSIRVGGELLMKLILQTETLSFVETPATRDFDFSLGIVGAWVTLLNNILGYHIQHELLTFVEDDDITNLDTEDYYYVPAPMGKQDGRWGFSTWA